MHTVVLVSPRVDQWSEFAGVLEADGRFATVTARSGADALTAAKGGNLLAMAIDENLGDMSGIELATQLLSVNAMINVAMASDRSSEDFHEETEGLGLLMQLSPIPTTAEAGRLAERLRQFTGNI
jgi:DNA-binding response OmpR family regulator